MTPPELHCCIRWYFFRRTSVVLNTVSCLRCKGGRNGVVVLSTGDRVCECVRLRRARPGFARGHRAEGCSRDGWDGDGGQMDGSCEVHDERDRHDRRPGLSRGERELVSASE